MGRCEGRLDEGRCDLADSREQQRTTKGENELRRRLGSWKIQAHRRAPFLFFRFRVSRSWSSESSSIPSSSDSLWQQILSCEFQAQLSFAISELTSAFSFFSVILFIVIVFHQTFEGLGLGSRLAFLPLPRSYNWVPVTAGTACETLSLLRQNRVETHQAELLSSASFPSSRRLRHTSGHGDWTRSSTLLPGQLGNSPRDFGSAGLDFSWYVSSSSCLLRLPFSFLTSLLSPRSQVSSSGRDS